MCVCVCVCAKQQASILVSNCTGLGVRQASGAVYQQGLSATGTRVHSAPIERVGNCLDMRGALPAHSVTSTARQQRPGRATLLGMVGGCAGWCLCVTVAQTAHAAAAHRSSSAH